MHRNVHENNKKGSSGGKEILTIEEASLFLQIGKRSLYKLVKKGEIPGKKILNKWRFDKDTLVEWLREGKKE